MRKVSKVPSPRQLIKPVKKALYHCYKDTCIIKRADLIDEVITHQCKLSDTARTVKHKSGDLLINHMIDLVIHYLYKNNLIYKTERGVYTLTDSMFNKLF